VAILKGLEGVGIHDPQNVMIMVVRGILPGWGGIYPTYIQLIDTLKKQQMLKNGT